MVQGTIDRVQQEKARREASIERDKRVSAAIEARLAAEQADLLMLQGVVRSFFAEESAGKTYGRRPPLGIKLPAFGEPAAVLAIYPDWDRRRKQLDLGRIHMEILVDRINVFG